MHVHVDRGVFKLGMSYPGVQLQDWTYDDQLSKEPLMDTVLGSELSLG